MISSACRRTRLESTKQPIGANPTMAYVVLALLLVAAIQAAAIVALLVQRSRRARAERALRESEERFRLMVDRSPAMMWTAGRTRRRSTTSTAPARSSRGCRWRSCARNGWLDAVHPEDLDPALGIYVSAFEARTAIRRGVPAAQSRRRLPMAAGHRAFRGMGRTAALRATSAATSTSPNAGMPKTGFARAGPLSRPAIERSSTWPAG